MHYVVRWQLKDKIIEEYENDKSEIANKIIISILRLFYRIILSADNNENN